MFERVSHARARASLGAAALAALLGCAAEPARRTPERRAAEVVPAADPIGSSALEDAIWPDSVDPDILLPSADSADDVVARVGDLAIHKRHVYEHLLKTEPAAPRQLVDSIVLDALVARAAHAWDIGLESGMIEQMAEEQEAKLREEVERQLGSRVTFERYLESQFGMKAEEYPKWLRTKLTRSLYRQYVVRYAALREDRVEVRYVVHNDRKVLEEIADKVRQGASFATLALRHSEGQNRMDRGLLPAFGRSFDHPVADVAFQLDIGQLSEIFLRESQGAKRYYLVYCLRKIPGRDVSFAEVAAELERDIQNRPLTGLEFQAAAECLKARMEALDAEPSRR